MKMFVSKKNDANRDGGRPGAVRCAALCGLVVIMVSVSASASNESPGGSDNRGKATKKLDPETLHGITLSELVFRVPEQAWIGTVKDGLKVDLLEAMRGRGFHALGAENLVFGTDKSDDARFVLGGTINDLECNHRWPKDCRIAVNWELLDRRGERVVYRVLARGIERAIPYDDGAQGFRRLLLTALSSVMSRPRFVGVLTKKEMEPKPHELKYEKVAFLGCATQRLKMPRDTRKTLEATVLVQSGEVIGSGVVISGDGFVLTAAHVLESDDIHVKFQNGVRYEAKAIRIDRRRDVALLKIEETDVPCLKPNTEPAEMGESIFAIGSPASSELAFSLTTGIVSAFREWEDVKFIQTDASINSGNSGGPMVNNRGEVVGIVSWKLAGIGVEGIAFGVPVHAALEALGLEAGAATAAELTEPEKIEIAKEEREAFADEADPYVSLDMEAEIRKVQLERAGALSSWATMMGALSIGTGAAIVGFSGMSQLLEGEDQTQADFYSHRQTNDVGWMVLTAGAALLAGSYLLLPTVDAEDVIRSKTQAGVQASMGFTGNGFMFEVRY